MADGLDEFVGRKPERPPLIAFECNVVNGADSIDDQVDVRERNGNQMIHRGVAWTPKISSGGQTQYPQPGDEAVVLLSDEGRPWMIEWRSVAAGEVVSPENIDGSLYFADDQRITFRDAAGRYSIDALNGDLRFFTEASDGTGGALRASLDRLGTFNIGGNLIASGYLQLADTNYKISAVAPGLVQFDSASDYVFRSGSIERIRLAGDGSIAAGAFKPSGTTNRLQGGSAGAGRVEIWDRLGVSHLHTYGSFTDPGAGGIYASGDMLAAGSIESALGYYGPTGLMFQGHDSWLRINGDAAFTSGLYVPGRGIDLQELRVGSSIQAGSVGTGLVGDVILDAGNQILYAKRFKWRVSGVHDFFGIYAVTETGDIGGGAGYADKLYIRNHLGIKYDAYSGGGGHRFYIGYNPSGDVTGLAFSIGEGDNDVRVHNPLRVNGNVGFYGVAPIARPVVSGPRGEDPLSGDGIVADDATLANLLTALHNLGIINNQTTA